MEKESLGLSIYERLKSSFESFTDKTYGDNPSLFDLLHCLNKNLLEEVAESWCKFAKDIVETKREHNIESLEIYLTLLCISKPEQTEKSIEGFYKNVIENKDTYRFFCDFLLKLLDMYDYPSYNYLQNLVHVTQKQKNGGFKK
jgi:hypothetical protein